MQWTILFYARYPGGSNSFAGLMIGGYTLSALVLRPVFGNMPDHFGRRIILLSGALLIGLTCFSYSVAHIMVVACRELYG